MAVLQREMWLPKAREEVFRFFADARNLQRITPEWLDFQMVENGRIDMRPGTLITYRLRLHGLPLSWISEITVWDPPVRFVDEQRRGPYRFWRHEHRFETHNRGTLVKDRVEYRVLGGWLVDSLFVKRDLARIFDFREQALRKIFIGEESSST